MPLTFSIITATLNSADTLLNCLESVQEQSLSCQHMISHMISHMIIDGGSTDDTLRIIEAYQFENCHVISEPDNGMYDAMNKGIRMASGDILGILNADDFYADRDVLSKVADIFQDDSIDSCYGDLQYVDRYNVHQVVRHWRAGRFERKRFLWGWMPPHPTFFVRRSVYEKFGNFNLNLGSAADYELMLRFLVKHKISTAYIPGVLVKMRIGGKSNASLKNRLIANRFDRMAWKVNGLRPYPWTLTLKPLRKIGQYIFKSK